MVHEMAFRLPPGIGKGALAAFAMLCVLNGALLSDVVVHRYASVFAVGRAMDKQLYLEGHPPVVLALGNSRVDNGIDPAVLRAEWGGNVSVFNHGIPGANARVMHGMLERLSRKGSLASVKWVLIGLDESFLQADESLGYVYFFGDRASLWAARQYGFWFGSWVRLWSYSDNLRELREPEKALRFVQATLQPLEPVGGAASRFQGYRKGFHGGGQDAGQLARQEASASQHPDPSVVAAFESMLDLLQESGIRVAVTFPPYLHRQNAYLDPSPARAAFSDTKASLKQRGVIVLDATDPVPREAVYFVNAGHLNDDGAQIYSTWIARALRSEMGSLVTGKAQ